MNIPKGCPGCNPTEITPILEQNRITAHEVPPPRHKWDDVNVCNECGKAWLISRKTENQ
jgi:hypothetical protein